MYSNIQQMERKHTVYFVLQVCSECTVNNIIQQSIELRSTLQVWENNLKSGTLVNWIYEAGEILGEDGCKVKGHASGTDVLVVQYIPSDAHTEGTRCKGTSWMLSQPISFFLNILYETTKQHNTTFMILRHNRCDGLTWESERKQYGG